MGETPARSYSGTPADWPSWGRFPRVRHAGIVPVRWRGDPLDLAGLGAPVLPRGFGRSYGDSCLNEGGILLDARHLRRFIAFDRERGTLTCEAGVSIAEILALVVPHGWFLPVVPGTQFVSVGGAIANDIHGKNHHRQGSFGCHVRQLELLRSSGERLTCSPDENSALFAATVGGLGLTGLILSAELHLKRIPGRRIAAERIRFASLAEFFRIAGDSDASHEYTVAWVDCLATSRRVGRGVFFRGNPAPAASRHDGRPRSAPRLRVPFDAPGGVLNPVGLRAFNALYYRLPAGLDRIRAVDYSRFFFPLDRIRDWNRLYGRRGFLQYQCVVPPAHAPEVIQRILHEVSRSRSASFLAVLKNFGDRTSPGMLSFPRPGSTLALDLPQRGDRTFALLDQLDAIVREAGGAVYPAKDARMSAETFQSYFPNWQAFAGLVDPVFSSSFWRRVTIGEQR